LRVRVRALYLWRGLGLRVSAPLAVQLASQDSQATPIAYSPLAHCEISQAFGQVAHLRRAGRG